jgi:hypothetical protein
MCRVYRLRESGKKIVKEASAWLNAEPTDQEPRKEAPQFFKKRKKGKRAGELHSCCVFFYHFTKAAFCL